LVDLLVFETGTFFAGFARTTDFALPFLAVLFEVGIVARE
jgi:hypothetical protein